MSRSHPLTSRTSGQRGVLKLLAVIGFVCLFWGKVLPAYSLTEGEQRLNQKLDEAGINPMAMFYDEHPMMLERLRDGR